MKTNQEVHEKCRHEIQTPKGYEIVTMMYKEIQNVFPNDFYQWKWMNVKIEVLASCCIYCTMG